MNACTIVARNYLAHARVLARSFLEHHPGGSFSVLVIDEAQGAKSERGEAFSVLVPDELGLPEGEWHRMAMLYDVTELATAIKPSLMRHLLDQDGGPLAYFDPDIEIFTPLDPIFDLAGSHPIVLTPHTTEPMPRDTHVPNEITLLLAGIYNLGFIAVGDDGRPFLDWWSQRLARDCFLDPSAGHAFVDQRWVDFAPGLFDHVILRDTAYNVAYWNLPTRTLQRTAETYEVDGNPLRFFHFSGFDPEKPYVLSKHQGELPRILLSEHPDLARLCSEYAEKLLADGYRQVASDPYGLGTLPGGVPIDKRMRRLYRAAVASAELGEGDEPPDPFDPEDPDKFLNWLREPFDHRGQAVRISRYLRAAYAEDPSLSERFYDLRWLHGDAFVEWVRGEGRIEMKIPSALVPEMAPPEETAAAAAAKPVLAEGINVVGYLRAELGVGEAARQVIGAIERAGIPYATLTHTETSSRQEHPFGPDLPGMGTYVTNLICINADRVPDFTYEVGPEFFENRYSIGVWWWEIGEFPKELHRAFESLHEVWVGSQFIADAISKHTSKPVLTMPFGIDVKESPAKSRADLGLPDDRFLFLFSFDFFSAVERKNPLGLIEAYERAFPDEGQALLMIKSINGDKVPLKLEELLAATKHRPDIRIVDEYVSAEDKEALMASCDCYVSLHRSEGFGLTMAEAMAYGRPVVATGYSGNLAFMNEENSYLVPYELGRIPEAAGPYPAGSEWAEPNVEAAAELLRRVYEHPEEAAEKGRRAREDIRTNHTPDQTAAFIIRRMGEIRAGQATEAAEEQEQEGPDGLERAGEFLVHGPTNPIRGPSRLGRAGIFARRVLYRLLRPYTARQRELEGAVVDALRDLTSEQREQGERLADGLRRWEKVRDRQLEDSDRIGHTDRQIAAIRAGDLTRRVDSTQERLEEIAELAGQLTPLPTHPALVIEDELGREIIGYRNGEGTPAGDDLYRRFEDVFRGSEELIRDRQRMYVELVAEHQPVLDLGCGRGEFLDLLDAVGVDGRGVDQDAGMVAHCRERGLDVTLADAADYLEEQPDASYGAIFSAHVLEHLDYDALVRLLGLVRRKLAPGGIFIAETVNPHSFTAFRAFWLDPTHRAPLYPEVLTLLCRVQGFSAARVLFPGGSGDLERDRRDLLDYGVVAERGNG